MQDTLAGTPLGLAAESGQVLWSQDVPSYETLGIDWTALYAAGQTGAVTAGNLVAAGERPLPFAAGLAHGIGGQTSNLGFGHPLPAPVLKGVPHRLVPDIDNARCFPEPVDRALVLDGGQGVHDRVGIDQFTARQGFAVALIFIVRQVALRQVVGHAAFDAHPPLFAGQQVLDKVGNQLDLILAAHGGKAEDMLLVQPGIIGHTGRIDHKGKGRGQAFGRNHHKTAPGTEGIQGPGQRAQPGAQVDIDIFLCHLRLDGANAGRKINIIGIIRSGHGINLLREVRLLVLRRNRR